MPLVVDLNLINPEYSGGLMLEFISSPSHGGTHGSKLLFMWLLLSAFTVQACRAADFDCMGVGNAFSHIACALNVHVAVKEPLRRQGRVIWQDSVAAEMWE